MIDLKMLYDQTFTRFATGLNPPSYKTEGQIPLGEFVMTKDITIENKPLPAGMYAYQFVLKDVFGNEWAKVHVPFQWDGEKVTYDFEQYKSLLNSR